jgi:hypothetical protein
MIAALLMMCAVGTSVLETAAETAAPRKAELDVHLRKALESNKRTLHIWGIPADAVANECAVVRLDF